MGRISKSVFGRARLPKVCIIYAGVYFPRRVQRIMQSFDECTPPSEEFIRFSFAKKDGEEVLLCFGVYGAVLTLELLQCLRDGGTKTIIFLGALGAKALPVGTIVLPVRVIDKVGIVSLDDPRRKEMRAEPKTITVLERILQSAHVEHERCTIVSVPSVLHGVERVYSFVRERQDVAGVELELSTLYHFSKKLGMTAYALVYVLDNQAYNISHRAMFIQRARREAMETLQRVALELLESEGL